MIQIRYSKENINVSKFHDELGDIGEIYFLTHDEVEMTLQFPELFMSEIETFDEEENVIGKVIRYEKKSISMVTEIVEGEEVTKEVETFIPTDFNDLLSQIQVAIDVHDPTPISAKSRLTVEQMDDVLTYLMSNL